MANAAPSVFCDPSTLNLVPLPTGLIPLASAAPAPPLTAAPAPRTDSLSRLPELHRFLLQCDQPSYYGNYHQVRPSFPISLLPWHPPSPLSTLSTLSTLQLLQTAPPDQLREFLKSLKQRSEWLDDQQAIEFKRMKALQILSPALTSALTETPIRAPVARSPVETAAVTPAAALQGHKLINSVTPPAGIKVEAVAAMATGAMENEPPAAGKRKQRATKVKAQETLGGKRKRG
jgi:hypothetical protein